MRLSYIVLYCKDLNASRHFYGLVGLVFVEERHGRGPLHFSADVSGVTVELYPLKGSPSDAKPQRVGFAITDFAAAVGRLRAAGFEPMELTETPAPERAGFLDPDGRFVDLSADTPATDAN